jgi:hypothetical protein
MDLECGDAGAILDAKIETSRLLPLGKKKESLASVGRLGQNPPWLSK